MGAKGIAELMGTAHPMGMAEPMGMFAQSQAQVMGTAVEADGPLATEAPEENIAKGTSPGFAACERLDDSMRRRR